LASVDPAEFPQRQVVEVALRRLAPFGSLLEIGSHVGPNLRIAHALRPTAALIGVDVHPDIMAWGTRLAEALALPITFRVADLRTFAGPERVEIGLICHLGGPYDDRRHPDGSRPAPAS
jgi:hypothetical protein